MQRHVINEKDVLQIVMKLFVGVQQQQKVRKYEYICKNLYMYA